MPTSTDFTVTLKRATGITLCEVVVRDEDGEVYHLQVLKSSDRKDLVKELVAKLAEVWPSPSFDFESDKHNVITKVL